MEHTAPTSQPPMTKPAVQSLLGLPNGVVIVPSVDLFL
jgi:hypothetical protein